GCALSRLRSALEAARFRALCEGEGSVLASQRLLCGQAAVCGFNKLLGICPPETVVVQRRPVGLDLLERLSFLDRILNPVAYNRDHIPVIAHVGLVIHASVTRNHHGSSLLPKFRYGDIQNSV